MSKKRKQIQLTNLPEYDGDMNRYDIAVFELNPTIDRFSRLIAQAELVEADPLGENNPVAAKDVVHIRRVSSGVLLKYYQRPGSDHPYSVTLYVVENPNDMQRRWGRKCQELLAYAIEQKRPLVAFLSPGD